MFRRFMLAVLMLVPMLIDTSVIPFLTGSPYVPLLTLVSVIVVGLLLGRTRGSLFGLIAGLLLDISIGHALGLMAVVFLGSGYLSGLLGRRYQRLLLTPVFTPLICYGAYELIMVGYLFLADAPVTLTLLRDGLVRLVIAVILTQPCYLLYDRILQPSWSRYAGR